ncbi:MAG: translation initiation factor IF-3, partial [Geobacteraceae bacterium]|nr:translation initiation factor IF-3 [Geobacteraceae bacterium]
MAKPTVNINQAIRAREVRVVGAASEQLGILPLSEALALAESQHLDLVEVSPTAVPPVCRIMDYGKFKYQQSKRQQEARKKQVQIQLKEIKLRPKTDDHDILFKI